MQLTRVLHKGVQEHPDAAALICGERRCSWAGLAGMASRIAAALQARGLRPGDRVGVLAANSDLYVACLYGIWWAGGVANPVNIRWTPAEIAFSIDDCDTGILFFDPSLAAVANEVAGASGRLRELIGLGGVGGRPGAALGDLVAAGEGVPDACRHGEDLAVIMYTGGTTGRSKGVMLSHANLHVSALSSLSVLPSVPDLVGAVIGPLFHVGGLGHLLMLMHRQATAVVLPGFDEHHVLGAIHEHRINEINLVPTMIKRLLDHPGLGSFDLSSLTTVCYGAAPIDATLLARALERIPGAEFFQFYGMTELSPAVTCLRAWDHRCPGDHARLRSAGRPLPIAEVAVLDPQGRLLPRGKVGEIVARGPVVMQGYWNLPGLTEETVREGWMHTGDLGFFDDDGYLFVVDRLKDMIVTGGENVYSAEVEDAIAAMPEVAMVAVVGMPDAIWGERVHAVVVLHRSGALGERDVIAHCRSRIAAYKSPRSVEFRETLPLSAAGKVLKQDLRRPIVK